jgi:hypothetical protein
MTTIGGLRTGLATNLAKISLLRTAATVPDDPKPPVAVVMPPSISFDTAMGRGLDTYEFVVLLIVGRVSDRAAQNTIDGYCNPTGATSVKAAIESDRTLGGAACDLRVTDMRGVSSISIADTTYLTAEFLVTVYAT